jgi:hypothetical protein
VTTPIAPATSVANGPTTAKVKPSGWWLAFAIFLLLVGPGGCTTVLVTKSVSFINGYNRYASFRMPVEDGTVELRQSIDRVGIFLRAANESGGAAVDSIVVTSPSGQTVELLTPQDSINAPVPSGGYLSILRYFRVDESGEYHVRATSGAEARGAELGIGKYDVDNLSSWLAGGFAAGGGVFLIGLVMLIIVLVRRSRSKRQIRMAGIPPGPPGPPYWGQPGAPPPPPPGWGTTPTAPPSEHPPNQYPPFPAPPQGQPQQPPSQVPPQPQQPNPPPGWGSPPPPPPPGPPPPEQWAPAPWSAPSEPAPQPPPTAPPPASPAPSPSRPTGVPGAPVSAPIPTVRPWRDPPRRSPEPEPADDDESGAPDPPA